MPDEFAANSNQFDSEDDAQLAAHGYVSSFKREFSNLATISFAFSIMVKEGTNLACSLT
jgi:predicted ester cyclase